jgi:hypothetical protein
MYSFRLLLEFVWNEREKLERQTGQEPSEDWSGNPNIQASGIIGLVRGIRYATFARSKYRGPSAFISVSGQAVHQKLTRKRRFC